MKRFGVSAACAFALIALAVPVGASGWGSSPPPGPPVQFTHGVASGDVTQSRAVLWTRVDGPRKVTVEVSWNPKFWGWKSFTGNFRTSAARDFTVKIDANRLCPGLRYWYRFKASPNDSGRNATYSDVGTFKTAPWRFAQVERRVHLGRRLRHDPRGRRQPVQQLGGAGPRPRGERRLLRLPRRHDLLGLEPPAERPGDHAGRVPRHLRGGSHLPGADRRC